jgi:hypothetical protein
LLVNREDSETRIAELERELAQQRRIAELERQLAEAKAAAGGAAPTEPSSPPPDASLTVADPHLIDEHARRLAEALRAERDHGSPPPDMAQLRGALMRAAIDAHLSPDQYRDVLSRAGLRSGGKITVGGQVAYHRCDPHDPVFLAPRAPRPPAAVGTFAASPRRRMPPVGPILAVLGSLLGLCIGVAAAVTALIPASALWMSPIVCPGGYDLAYNTSNYSYKPGQSGTTVDFQCVSGTNAYDVSDLAVIALQCLLIALVVGVVGGLTWRLTRKRP